MDTLASILGHAESKTSVYTDSSTPEGHFAATSKVLGITTTYLLRGTVGDPHAPILGRVEIQDASDGSGNYRTVAYRGDRLKGGKLAGYLNSYEEIFADFAS